MWCATDNYNHMCHICAKGCLDSNFKQLLTKYHFFTKLNLISDIHRNGNVLQNNWNFLEQLFL